MSDFSKRLISLAAGCFLLSALAARAAPSLTATFLPVQAGRDYMDIGGVWNGTAEVTNTTGDGFRVVIANDGVARNNFALTITLPSHFQYVANTVSSGISGGCTAPTSTTASQVGTTLSVVFNSGAYTLGANCTLTVNFGLRVATTMPTSGTYQLNYSTTGGGATTQDILVLQGASILTKTPTDQLRAVNENAVFTVTVVNSGLGALFDVTINESAIFPSGQNLTLVSMTKTAPARATTGSVPTLTMPYLAPGESYVVTVVATVNSCGNILNTVASNDRTNFTNKSINAPVVLNLQEPLIAYTPPATALSYAGPVAVSFQVQNTGAGAATNIVLDSNLNTLGVTVSSVGAGWNYNPANGQFTYTGGTPAGSIPNAGSATLSYQLAPNDYCAGGAGGTVVWYSSYTNPCNDPYSTPTVVSSVSAPTNAPAIALNQTVSAIRLANAETGSFNLTFDATNANYISGASFTVTETLPANLTGISLVTGGASPSNASRSGNVVTWTITRQSPATNATLTINFTAQADPCAAGNEYTANATVSATSTRSCPLSDSDGATYLLTNNPGLTAQQFFDITSAPDGLFETGNSSANATREIATGEGEFIPFTCGYSFGPGYPGTWTNSTFVDNFAGVAEQTLVPGTLDYSTNGGGSWTAVPGGSVSGGAGSLSIDLSFLTGVFGNANVANRSIQFRYRTTIPDAALGGANTRNLLQETDLTITGANGAGSCTSGGSNFRQGVYYTVGRAAATVGVTLPVGGNDQIAICETIDVTLTIGNATAELARNLLVTLNNDPSQYTYLTGGDQTITYGGVFNGGNIVYTENGGLNPTWRFTGTTLTGQGTITFKARLKATAPLTPSTLGATVDYDDVQTSPSTGTREFTATGNDGPFLVRSADLLLNVTPDTVVVTGSSIQWRIYVTNSGDGPAYNATLRNTFYAGFDMVKATIDAANPGYPVTIAGNELSWPLGDLPSGVTRIITVVAGVDSGTTCTVPLNQNTVVAEWGCGGSLFQTVTEIAPNYNFPPGQMLTAHDTVNSSARLCEDGTIIMIVRNTGPTEIFNVTLKERLDPTTTGLSLIPNTVEYSTNGGATWSGTNPAYNPSGTGAPGNEYTWTSAQIPPLANLKPFGGSPQEVRVRFGIFAAANFASAGSISALASATGTIACGDAVSSPGTGASIPALRPSVNIAVTGRNLTVNPGGAYTETVYGGVDETIEWRVFIENTGNLAARNVRFNVDLPGTTSGTPLLNGNGYVNATFTELTDYNHLNQAPPNNTLAAGANAVYLVTQVLGNNCVASANAVGNVIWGCYPPNPIGTLTQPGTPTDTATLDMVPSFTGGVTAVQTVTAQPGGRARIELTLTNSDATAANISISSTLSAGFTLDDSYAPTISGTGAGADPNTSITGVAYSAPSFTLTGRLLNARFLTVTYYVYNNFQDDLAAPVANAVYLDNEITTDYDEATPADGTNTLVLSYSSTCGAALPTIDFSSPIPLLTPDLDITSDPGNVAVAANAGFANYDFRIRNNGFSGPGEVNADAGSQASSITIRVFVGLGWELAGTGAFDMITTSTVAPAYNADYGVPTVVGEYNRYDFTVPAASVFPTSTNNNNNVLVRVRARPNTAGGTDIVNKPLGMYVEIEGNVLKQDGSDTGLNYSFDRRRPRIIGIRTSKTLQSTSEPDTSVVGDVLIGEEATFRVKADIFGFMDGETFGAITLRDTLFDNNPAAPAANYHNLLGYLSHTDVTLTNLTTTSTNPGQVNSGRIAWTVTYVPATTNVMVYEADVQGRVLNLAGAAEATDGQILNNNFGLSLSYFGQTFRSNNADDGFGGGTATANAHAEATVTVRRPNLVLDKTVRNFTTAPAGPFTQTATAQAFETVEYRYALSNTGSAPAYDLTLADALPPKLNLVAATVFADLNGNDAYDAGTDVPLSAGLTGGNGGSFTVDQTQLVLPTAGQNLVRLDPGQSIVILYRSSLLATVTPSEQLDNTASASGDTLPGATGSQTVPQLPNGNAAGADVLSVTDTARVTVTAVNQLQVLTNTSVLVAGESYPGSPNTNLLIGEQAEIRQDLILPQGTIPNLIVTITIPAGLQWLGNGTAAFGPAISPNNQPVVTTNPLTPQPDSETVVTLTYGNLSVAAGTEADRTIRLFYYLQSTNIDANNDGNTRTIKASYNFTGAPNNFNDIVLTLQEPILTAAKSVTPDTNFDAGDTLTFTVTLTNNTGDAPAYDLNWVDSLPNGLTYVPGSATLLTGPGQTTGLVDGAGVPIAALTQPDVALVVGPPDYQTLTFGRTQSTPVSYNLLPNGRLVFTIQATADNTIEPAQALINNVVVDATSLPGNPGPNLAGQPVVQTAGDPRGERTGSQSPARNDLRATASATATPPLTVTLTKTASGDTLPIGAPVVDGGFRIGDLITYTVVVTVPEGTFDSFRIRDTLPTGLAFDSFDAITPASGVGTPITYTAPVAPGTAPAAGATGTLTWNLGTLVNPADGPPVVNTLTLVYRARVNDNLAAFPLASLNVNRSNSALVRNQNFAGADVDSATATDQITVRQPRLTIGKTLVSPVDATLHTGETARFRLTITNTGNAPAYNPTVTDTLPVGLRGATPTLVSATLGGADITGSAPALNYVGGTGLITWAFTDDTQFLLPNASAPNNTLVLTYDVTAGTGPLNVNQLNSATVSQFFSKPSADPTQRRQYPALTAVNTTVILRPIVSGYVYWDIIANSVKDGGEDWTQGPQVYVNLVQGGVVQRSVTINPGTGFYEFQEVLPGNYQIVVSNSAVNPNAVAPVNWFFRAPPNGLLPLTVANANLANQNFGLFTGSTIDGRVFQDDGRGPGGVANDGAVNGSETGLANVLVQLTDCAGTVYHTDLTDGAGYFTLLVPTSITTGTPLCVIETNLASFTSTGGQAGDTGGTYTRATDTLSFTFTSGINYTGLLFGDVPPSRLLTDGTQTIMPGSTAFHPHQFIAGTAGNVSFSLTSVATPAIPGWSTLLYLDSNGNSLIDAGDPMITAPIAVTAGQTINLLVKDTSPVGDLYGAQNSTTITAVLTYATQPALTETLQRHDLTILGTAQTDGLRLVKSTDKATALPGENITYTITYTNLSAGVLNAVVIHDQTPTFTTFVSAAFGPLPSNLTACTILPPTVGTAGGITWTFTGTLLSGASGQVTYIVKIDQ